MAVRIVTDSTCDLPRDVVERYGITVVPLTLTFGDEEFLDWVDIDANAFYAKLVASHDVPRTSQPTVARFRDAYRAIGPEHDIVSVHISSRLSGTLNSASIAREELAGEMRIDLIDSHTVSLGMGAVALEAAIVAQRGGTLEEVAAAARHTADRVRVVALVDTLEYLRRGGRIGRAQSMLGSLLSIKPLLHVDKGEVAPFDRVRTRSKAVQRLFEIATEDRTLKRVFLGCGGNDAEALEFMERLRPLMPHTEFILGQVGPAVGVHSGPNVLGVGLVGRD
ncbi:MAG: DegV family protein [Dehalococcoidia bacterium]|nr:DegV family protein [Dehalococcoidia bacterium]